MRRIFLLLAVLLSPALPAHSVAGASSPEKVTQLVYALNLFEGKGYAASFAPQNVNTVYLMAGKDNAISPTRTLVYFWPITSRYHADLASMNEPVGEVAEVFRDGKRVGEIARSSYALAYPEGIAAGRAVLVSGDAAQRTSAEFQAEQERYWDTLSAYYSAQIEYAAAFQAYLAAAAKGATSARPSPPTEPSPIKRFVSKPESGFIVNLPGGSYTLRVRDGSGQVVEGSQRALKVISPRRHGIGYNFFVEDRWTLAGDSSSFGEDIYTVPGAKLYLQASRREEFSEFEYAKILEPQSNPGAERWRWLETGEALKGKLRVLHQGGQAIELLMRPYTVQHSPGAAWGYEIAEFDLGETPDRPPDFSAYHLAVGMPSDEYTIQMVDDSGAPLPNSTRRIRVAPSPFAGAIFAVPLLPLLLGLLLIWSRRHNLHPQRETRKGVSNSEQ